MAPPVKPGKANLPALHGRLMVDTINGKIRIRKWPEKRGKNVPEQVRIQNERFAAAQRLAKTTKGSVFNRFIEATKNTGLYPRDLFTRLVLAAPIEFEHPDGHTVRHGRETLEDVLFQGFRLQRTSNHGIPATTLTGIEWNDPIRDTSGFWNIAAPSVITIPQGVRVIDLTAGLNLSASLSGQSTVYIERASSPGGFVAISEYSGFRRATVSTGPLVVDEGEQFRLAAFCSSSATAVPAATFFGGNILGAEI